MESGRHRGQPGSPSCHHGDSLLIRTPGFQRYRSPPLLCSERERTNESEKEEVGEWVDLTNLFCSLFPVCYCYKKSRSIMQCETKNTGERKSENERQEKERERERGKEKGKPCYLHEPYLAFSSQNNGRKQVHGNFSSHTGVCVPIIWGLADPPRSVLTSPSDRDNRVGAVTTSLCLSAH